MLWNYCKTKICSLFILFCWIITWIEEQAKQNSLVVWIWSNTKKSLKTSKKREINGQIFKIYDAQLFYFFTNILRKQVLPWKCSFSNFVPNLGIAKVAGSWGFHANLQNPKKQIVFSHDCHGIRIQIHLVRKWTLNHLAIQVEWLSCVVSTYLYGAFDCMFLSCHVRALEWIYTLCRVNAWMSSNFLLETGTISEV